MEKMKNNNILKIIGIIFIIIFIMTVITFFSRQKIIIKAFEINFLEGTEYFNAESRFQFSISPMITGCVRKGRGG